MELQEQRIADRLLELVKINAPSHHERPMADYLLHKLKELGCEVKEDGAGLRYRDAAERQTHNPRGLNTPQTGNVIATLKGTVDDAPALLFAAHMDTILPTQNISPRIDAGVVATDGKTILGADDRAGICALLEALHVLRENPIPHGDLQFAFLIAEETGLFGSLFLDMADIKADYAFVMDSGGSPDTIIVAAPTEIDFKATIYGKAAHAGVNPEDGVNAISVAADAISHLRLGRLDDETTVNIGIIQGGERSNIVCDRVEVHGEVRSRNESKLSRELANIHTAFQMAGEKWCARVDVSESKIYQGFALNTDDEVVQLAQEALRKIGLVPALAPRGGGSDANNFNAKGIPAVNLGVGANQDHTVDENVRLEDLLNATRLVLGIIRTAAERAGVSAS